MGWLNQVEWFALITERAICRNSFISVREREQQIELFVQRHDADATPFQWVATADSILQKIERAVKPVSATGHWRCSSGQAARVASQSDGTFEGMDRTESCNP